MKYIQKVIKIIQVYSNLVNYSTSYNICHQVLMIECITNIHVLLWDQLTIFIGKTPEAWEVYMPIYAWLKYNKIKT